MANLPPTEQDPTLTDPQLRAGMSLDPKAMWEGLKAIQDFAIGPTPTEVPGQQEPGLQDVGMLNPVDYAVNAVPGVAKAMATDARTILGNERGSVNLPRLNQAAKAHFGTTQNIKEAGYITDQGELLDLSGRHYSTDHPSLSGTRNVDHRELPNTVNDIGGSEGMMKFQREAGAIRHMPETGGIDVVTMPTKEQLMTLSQHYSKNPEGLLVDITHPITGETIVSEQIKNPSYSKLKSFFDKHIDPLDMSPASRLQRAKSMGFDIDKVLYHGTKGDIESFAPEALGASTQAPSAKKGYFFATDAQTASDYSELSATRRRLSGAKDKEGMAKLEQLKAELNKADSLMNTPQNMDVDSDKHLKQFNESFEKIMKLQDELGLNETSWDVADKAIKNDPDINKLKGLLDKSESEFTNRAHEALISPEYDPEKYRDFVTGLEQERADIRNALRKKTEEVRMSALSEGANVIPVHLKMENPYIHDFKGATYRDESYNNILEKAKAGGHDSVIMKNTYDPANPKHKVMQDIHVVFDPSQIRSVNAKFDPSKASSSNITHYKGGRIQNFADGGQVENDPYASIRVGAPAALTPPGGFPITEQELQNFNPEPLIEAQKEQDYDNLQAQFATPGQQALTVLEGASKGFAGPIATGMEHILSDYIPELAPERQRARAEANPLLHGAAEVGGFVGPLFSPLAPLSMASALGKVGKAAGVGFEGATLLSRAMKGAVMGGVENTLFGAQDELSKLINKDPKQTADTAIMSIGLSGAIGGVIGSVFGAFTPAAKKAAEPVINEALTNVQMMKDGLKPVGEAGEEAVKNAEALGVIDEASPGFFDRTISEFRKPKENIDAIVDAAKRNNWPLLKGIISKSKDVQKAVDMLIKGPPSIFANIMKHSYSDAFNRASGLLKKSIGVATEIPSEAELGEMVKSGLSDSLESELGPTRQMYDAIDYVRKEVPIDKQAAYVATDEFGKMVKAKEIVKNTPEYDFMNTWVKNFSEATSLDELAKLKTVMGRQVDHTLKYAARKMGHIYDSMTDIAFSSYVEGLPGSLEKSYLEAHMENVAKTNAKYGSFRQKLKVLGDNLGKKKIFGPTDFENFISDINPQKLVKRIFDKDNVTFAKYFAENFPEQMALMRDYHRAQLIDKAGSFGDKFSPKTAYNAILKLPKEMQQLLYSPEEMQGIKDAKTYIDAFPDAFNPSGTGHHLDWVKHFSSIPEAIMSQAKDGAITAYIRAMGAAVPGSEAMKEAVSGVMTEPVVKNSVNLEAFKHGVGLVHSTGTGINLLTRAIKSAFNNDSEASTSISGSDLKTLDKQVQDYKLNPSLLDNVGGQVGHYLPDHATALKTTAANALSYLGSIRPKETKLGPLDAPIPPSDEAMAKYNHVLKLAQNPLYAIDLIKKGTITSEDMMHIRALYPTGSNAINAAIMDEMASQVSRGKDIPYETRQAFSTFMGVPLDSALNPQSIQMNQAVFMQNNQQKQMNNTKPSKSGMGKMKTSKMTSLHPPEED